MIAYVLTKPHIYGHFTVTLWLLIIYQGKRITFGTADNIAQAMT